MRIRHLILVAITVFFTASSLIPANAQTAAKYKMCVVHNNADHPSITAIVKGINDEAAIYGFQVTYFDPAFDPAKQASQIEDCIALKPDIIVINAVDPAAVVASMKKAKDAGIPRSE